MARITTLFLLVILLLVIGIPALLYFQALSPQPMAPEIEPADQQELMRFQQLITEQVGGADAQGRVQLELDQRDVNTAIEFGLMAGGPEMLEGVAAQIGEDELLVRGSVKLPIDIPRHYLNYQATLVPDGKTPHIASLRLGSIKLPGFVLQRIENRAYQLLASDQRLAMARNGWESIEDISINNGQLEILYRLTPATIRGLARQHSKLLMEQVDHRSVEYYLEQLEPYSRKAATGKYPLTSMLAPAFELALQRSEEGYDPIMENSAALLSLAMYTTKPELIEAMGLGERFGYPERRLTLTLYSRNDLANHFLTSAMISLFRGRLGSQFDGDSERAGRQPICHGFSTYPISWQTRRASALPRLQPQTKRLPGVCKKNWSRFSTTMN